MNTIVPSPKARLRAWLDKTRPASLTRPASITAQSWAGHDHLRVGDLVVERDSRHVARIDAIFPTGVARITYIDTKWRADVPLADLEKAND